MSITEIKNIKKLQEMLKSALDEIEYLKECCTKTGEELARYTFPYDYKEKNLVIQAKKINEEFERREKALDEITEIVSGKYEELDPLAKQQIFNIIKKAKDGNNE